MYLSGTALGGLISHPVLSMAGRIADSREHLPARVFITFREQTRQLAPAGHQLWRYKRAWVKLSYADGLQVEVSSPGPPKQCHIGMGRGTTRVIQHFGRPLGTGLWRPSFPA